MIKTIVRLAFLISVPVLFWGCSGSSLDEPDDVVKDASQPYNYYYAGLIRLTDDSKEEKPIYRINDPCMFPDVYGFNMAVPLPDGGSNLYIDLGEGTLIESRSVLYSKGNVEYVGDLPTEGREEYAAGFSITRINDDELVMHLHSSRLVDYDYVKILVKPIPKIALADMPSKDKDYRNFTEFGVPSEIGLQVFPFTFMAYYRPLMQVHLTEY